MEIQRLEYLVKVIETGSFSRAAAVLCMSQSALSRQIMELEQSVGQRLLLRTGRGVTPTEAGKLLLSHARAILSIAQHATQELADLDAAPRGRVTLGLPPLMALRHGGALIHAFRSRFPEAMLTLVEGLSMNLREWLVDGRLDAAVLYDAPPLPQMDYELLRREPLALFGSARGPALPAEVSIAKLPEYPLVLPSSPNAIRSLMDVALREKGVELKVIAEVASAPTLLALVSQGVGFTILPDSAVRTRLDAEHLQIAPLSAPTIRNRVMLAVPRTRPLSRLGRALIQLVKQTLGSDGWQAGVQGGGGSTR